VTKEFDIPDFAYYATVEFLLYEIDDWGAKDRSKNKFYVKIGATSFNLDTFEDEDSKFHPGNSKSGFKAGIKWKRQALTAAANFGYNEKFKDQIHKVSIKVPKPYFKNGKLNIQFDVSLMDTIDQVSAGVDEFRITAHPRRCKDTKRKTAEKDGKAARNAKIEKKKEAAKKGKSTKTKSKKSKKSKKNSPQRNRARVHKNGKRALEDGEQLDFEDDYDDELDPDSLEGVSADGTSTPVDCRVAFAYHSSKISGSFKNILGLREKFLYHDDDISWGWSNGPLASSNYGYSMDMFVAGESGVAVGKLTVEYDGSEATISVDARDRLWLKEINAYVGHSRLPIAESGELTIDPAEYPIAYERLALSRTFTVEDLNDEPLYVIAQATVCGVFPTEDSQDKGSEGAKWSLGGVLKNLV
jgi:hypothetical protein